MSVHFGESIVILVIQITAEAVIPNGMKMILIYKLNKNFHVLVIASNLHNGFLSDLHESIIKF